MNDLSSPPLPPQKRSINLVKKLNFFSKLRGAGTKPSSTAASLVDYDTKERPLPLRATRSMDLLSSKPFVQDPQMLTLNLKSQPLQVQLLERRSMDTSAQAHHEHVNEPNGMKQTIKTGMLGGKVLPTVMSSSPGQHPPQLSEPEPARRSVSLNAQAIRHSLSASPADEEIHTSNGKRPSAPPRLKTLPPLNFNLKDGDGSRHPRLSPSVIVRPPPFPILELPALPTPIVETPNASTSNANQRRRSQARLNSMPMLPMEGGDERENDPDHEHYGLDEEDEEEVDEGDDDDDDSDIRDAMGQSDDEDEETRPPLRPSPSTPKQSNFIGRNRTHSQSRLPDLLPRPSFSSILGSPKSDAIGLNTRTGAAPLLPLSFPADTAGSSAYSGKPAVSASTEKRHANRVPQPQDEVATPHVVVNGTARRDYFTSGLSAYATSSTPIQDERLRSNSASQRTPTASDYASSQASAMVNESPLRATEDPFRYGLTASNAMAVPHLVKVDDTTVTRPGTTARRPSFYQHASKSMVELFSAAGPPDKRSDAKGKGKGKHKGDDMSVGILSAEPRTRVEGEATDDDRVMSTMANESTSTLDTPPTPPPKPSSGVVNEPSQTLNRRRSMPMFQESGPPPPYPSFLISSSHQQAAKFKPSIREEEGIERLPPYTNDIYLAAVMPRKMEFTAPGVPARDRKWRRVYCVLEGTMFRVYDAPPRVSGVSVLGNWWERKVGVGDVTLGVPQSGSVVAGANGTNVVIGRREPRRRMKWEEEQNADVNVEGNAIADENAETANGVNEQSTATIHMHRSKRNLAASFLHPNRARHGRSASATSSRTSSPAGSPRSSMQMQRPSGEFGSGSSAPSSARPSTDLSSSNGHATGAMGNSSGMMMGHSASSSSVSGMSGMSSNSHLSVASHFRRHQHGQHGRSESAQVVSEQSQTSSSMNMNSSRPSSSSSTSPFRRTSENNGHTRSQSQPLNQLARKPYDAHAAPNTAATLPAPDARDLLHVYSLQRAESGLASDYLKRKNVVRVRMEGEQFLLQCTDVAMVVEWIEGLQAATNISLDLDERPMPKGPIFPRRRRRRRVVRADTATGAVAESRQGTTGSTAAAAS